MALVRLRTWLAVVAAVRRCRTFKRDLIEIVRWRAPPLLLEGARALNLPWRRSCSRVPRMLTSIASLQVAVHFHRLIEVLEDVVVVRRLVRRRQRLAWLAGRLPCRDFLLRLLLPAALLDGARPTRLSGRLLRTGCGPSEQDIAARVQTASVALRWWLRRCPHARELRLMRLDLV